MKIKISFTLSEEVLHAIDRRLERFKNRSDFIEAAVRAFLGQVEKEERNVRDLAIINARADDLNREAADVLEYQLGL